MLDPPFPGPLQAGPDRRSARLEQYKKQDLFSLKSELRKTKQLIAALYDVKVELCVRDSLRPTKGSRCGVQVEMRTCDSGDRLSFKTAWP